MTPAPRLWLVTRGAQPVQHPGGEIALAQAPLWGLGRVIALERPELRATLVDLDPTDAEGAEALAAELLVSDGEQFVARRGASRLVPRLTGGHPAHAAPAASLLRLDIARRGVLDNLAWIPAERRAPGRGQVEIQVEATGLNFRDVLNALGMYPGDAGPLGGEFAGRVVALGAGVETLAVGERVMGVGAGTFATSVVTDAALVVPVPAGLTSEAAAGSRSRSSPPTAPSTTSRGSAPGQRVLIHAAAGGVGLAAVALADSAGAEVFATAGSAEKRALLTSLGVEHVMDSRSLDFADEIHAAHRRPGRRRRAELAQPATSSRRACAWSSRGGRFVEIGKRGIWDATQVAAVRPDVDYHVLYLGDLFEREPAGSRRCSTVLAAEFAAGRLAPLPHRVYPAARAADAFRFMAQARHVGKLVVTPPASAPAARIRGDATYLITGGLGALGVRDRASGCTPAAPATWC